MDVFVVSGKEDTVMGSEQRSIMEIFDQLASGFKSFLMGSCRRKVLSH